MAHTDTGFAACVTDAVINGTPWCVNLTTGIRASGQPITNLPFWSAIVLTEENHLELYVTEVTTPQVFTCVSISGEVVSDRVERQRSDIAISHD
ncbi:hypothetical protein MLPF_0512 [Mycobacterium lepromatosis]|uniref:hypothetical protein n=1 Tax=Mycobacterium lepromatosis TaxID=480418 RepID=UPI0005F78A6C|nr:hypothetical protein [Mycobacterium lepromatosis]UKN41725.1 hypothetical protein MLPF_0512 [Mycobacterium lepromatosis]